MSRPIDYSKWDNLDTESSDDDASSSDDERAKRSRNDEKDAEVGKSALDHARKLRLCGNTLFEKKKAKPSESIKVYEEALAILERLKNLRAKELAEQRDAEMLKCHLNVAAVSGAECDDYAKAKRHAEAALRLSPTSAEAHHALGAAIVRTEGRTERALAHLRKACALAPKNENMRRLLDEVLASSTTKKTSAAPSPDFYKRIRALHAKATDAQRRRAFDVAAETWKEVLVLIRSQGGPRPEMEGGAHRQLAAAYRSMRNFKESQRHYGEVLKTFAETPSKQKLSSSDPKAVRRILRRPMVLLEKAQCAFELGSSETHLEDAETDFKNVSDGIRKQMSENAPPLAVQMMARADLGAAKCILAKRALRAKTAVSRDAHDALRSAATDLLVKAAKGADSVVASVAATSTNGVSMRQMRASALQITAEATETLGGLYAESAAVGGTIRDADEKEDLWQIASRCFERSARAYEGIRRDLGASKVPNDRRRLQNCNRLLLLAASAASRSDDKDAAVPLFKRVLESEKDSEGSSDTSADRALAGLANLFLLRSSPADASTAVTYFEKAIERASRRAKGDGKRFSVLVEMAELRLGMANALVRSERTDEAVKFVRSALQQIDSDEGEVSKSTTKTTTIVTLARKLRSTAAEMLLLSGRLHHKVDDRESAVGAAREALRRFRSLGDEARDASEPDANLIRYARRQQAVALQAIGTLTADPIPMREGLEILRDLKEEPRSVGGVCMSIGTLLAKQRKWSEACTALARARDAFRAAKDAVGQIRCLALLADAQAKMGASLLAKESLSALETLSSKQTGALTDDITQRIARIKVAIDGEGGWF